MKKLFFSLFALVLLFLLAEVLVRFIDSFLDLSNAVHVFIRKPVEDRAPPYRVLSHEVNCIDRISYRPSVCSSLIPNPLQRSSLELPRPSTKPESIRVFIVGGSAAWGDLVEYSDTFAGILSARLQEIGPFEIINVAQHAKDSQYVKDTVKRIVDCYFPDLIVIYSGNNEWSHWRINRGVPLADRIRHSMSHSTLFLYMLLGVRQIGAHLEAMKVSRKKWQEKDSAQNCDPADCCEEPRGFDLSTWKRDRKNYLRFYYFNMKQAVSYSKKNDVYVLVCTVPFRYRVCPYEFMEQPITEGIVDTATKKQVKRIFEKGLAALQKCAYLEALDFMLEADRLSSFSPLPPYFAGMAYIGLGKKAQALKYFEQARDKTLGNIGSLPSVNAILQRIAKENNVGLADLHQAFLDSFSDPLDSDSLFLDSCHPNEKGHRIIADVLEAKIKAVLPTSQ